MPSRLKSLELNGYKTFASRTTFEFAEAVTAIVGPNGSGKSNIADALRWVLGEQSYSLLRGRKTVDMIFSGSEQRARAGMASATILFDNSDEWLPIDFSEVSIARRAYRDGTNEYLVNGQRVRLRDVSELLAQSGLAERTYTIIGQGLVDVALSLRADERRRLFEEAAGIGLYRTRREEALRRLENTRRNMERAQDILAELRPRLRSLERQARRAREFEQIRSDLRLVLRDWYGFHWHQAQQEVILAQETAREREAALTAARDRQSHLDQELTEYTGQMHDLRTRLSAWHRELADLHSRREAISRDLAVMTERERSLTSRAHEWRSELERMGDDLAAREKRLEEAREALARRQEQQSQALQQAEGERQRLDDQALRRGQMETEVQDLRRRLESIQARLVETRARQAELQSREKRQEEGRSASDQAIERSVNDSQAAAEELRACESELESHRLEHEEAEAGLANARQRVAEAEADLAEVAATLAARQAEASRLSAQGEVLDQAEQALVGYDQGARVLLQAGQKTRLGGRAKALRSELTISEDLEAAMAAALGEYLDAILLESSGELDPALLMLQDQSAGAALLVMDRLAPPEMVEPPQDKDCLGVAARLIDAGPDLQPILDLLLGKVLVVRDRLAAERLLAGMPSGVRAVTLRGEVFHSEGPIVVRARKDATRLGRPRQRRQIQAALETEHGQIEALSSRQQEMEAELASLRQEVESQGAILERTAERLNAARLRYQEAQAAARQREREQVWIQEQGQALATELEKIRKDTQDLTAEASQLEADKTQLAADLDEKNQALADFSLEEARSQVHHWDLQAAVAEQALSEAAQLVAERQLSLDHLRDRYSQLSDRFERVTAEQAALVEEQAARREEEQEIAAQVEALSKEIQPSEKELENSEGQYQEFVTEEVRSRSDLSQAERYYTQAQIALARQQEALITLRRRIEDDFGLVAFEYEDEITGATPLPLEGMVEQLPRVDQVSPDIEDSLRRKKAHLRRMGAINPEAESEYQEVNERFTFLTSQMEDLAKAEADVLQVISELEEMMDREFLLTFEAVAEEFRGIFTRLFGGGSARLTLTDPSDLTGSGIDIEARLPGRREQGLSLLSGGERSLTATALIFALLKVSPTPFCVLDEVDAMLDEANIGRFRELLRELSQDTQFILITHNRNTVQVADVIYGVTMSRDSASQVLSLKLDDVEGVYAT